MSLAPRVLIAGGGPAGLLAALRLGRQGVETLVVERAAETETWSARSYSININPRGLAALATAGVVQRVRRAALERRAVVVDDGCGKQTVIPRDPPHLALSRPALVQCLADEIVATTPCVSFQRGSAVVGVQHDMEHGQIIASLDNGSNLTGTHIIAADGKWSAVRSSVGMDTTVRTEGSWGVGIHLPTTPPEWRSDATNVFKAASGAPFYGIASPLPDGGCSVSLVCFDAALETLPWLAPPGAAAEPQLEEWTGGVAAAQANQAIEGGDASASQGKEFEQLLAELLEKETPRLADGLHPEALSQATISHRVSWVETQSEFSALSGRAVLVGDAAHAMTPSLGEGCNCALESAAAVTEVDATESERPTVDDLTRAFLVYGDTRPAAVRSVQESSAAASRFAAAK